MIINYLCENCGGRYEIRPLAGDCTACNAKVKRKANPRKKHSKPDFMASSLEAISERVDDYLRESSGKV